MGFNFSSGRLFVCVSVFRWTPSHRRLLSCFSVRSDYESLRKEDVFENNRLVRSRVAELWIPVEATLCLSKDKKKKNRSSHFYVSEQRSSFWHTSQMAELPAST